eukprot:scaffold14.g1081.t1
MLALKLHDRDHVRGSHEDPNATPPRNLERQQRMAEVEADATQKMKEVEELAATAAAGERWEGIMSAIEALGEGPEAAELVARSYEGRDLEAEALDSMDPTDHMPHPASLGCLRSTAALQMRCGSACPCFSSPCACPGGLGDRYLPPQAGPSCAIQPGAGEARLNASVPGRHAQPVTEEGESEADDQIGLQAGAGPGGAAGTADDQIGWAEGEPEGHAVGPQPAAGPAGQAAGAAAGQNQEQEWFDVEKDALQGSDAMFYFKGEDDGPSQEGEPASAIRRALGIVPHKGAAAPEAAAADQVERRATAQDARAADGQGRREGNPARAGGAAPGAGRSGEDAAAELRRVVQEGVKKEGLAATSMQEVLRRIEARRGGGQAAGAGGRPSFWHRVLDVSSGRRARLRPAAALVGLAAAVAGELLYKQSVLSQLFGRWEGRTRVELPVPHSMLWAGRLAMALFAALVAYETLHSNRPLFGTLLYTWP